MQVTKVLKEIKKSIMNEDISMSEIAYLQSHKQAVLDFGDIELAQWADISEDEWNKQELEEI